MSAFIVGTDTMTRAVKAILAKQYGSHIIRRFADFETSVATAGRDIGRALFALNVEAVRQRYPNEREMWTCDDAETFDFADFRDIGKLELVGCYKALQCVCYQCNEGTIPEMNPLFIAMQEATALLAVVIVASLPEYERAPW